MTSLLTGLLGMGPAASVTHLVPDLHHYRGSFGGKGVISLWRNATCTEPNVTLGVLKTLARTPEDLFAYCFALLAAPTYAERFVNELEIPGPRVPLTRDRDLFERAAELGRRLIWLHTYGERFVPAGHRAGEVPTGSARCTRPVPEQQDDYPTSHSYEPERSELHVGAGTFAPITPAVRGYSVSGTRRCRLVARLPDARRSGTAVLDSSIVSGHLRGRRTSPKNCCACFGSSSTQSRSAPNSMRCSKPSLPAMSSGRTNFRRRTTTTVARRASLRVSAASRRRSGNRPPCEARCAVRAGSVRWRRGP